MTMESTPNAQTTADRGRVEDASRFDRRAADPWGSSPSPPPATSARRSAPHLSTRGLTYVLLLMCLAPVVTIFGLWIYLPPVHEGKLECSVIPLSLPPSSTYEMPYRDRPEFEGASLLVRNESDQDWTHLNVMINKHYQIYDVDPLRAGEERSYLLNRFIGRTGARFEIRYNPVRNVRVYARRPGGDRATHYETFSTPAKSLGETPHHD